MDFAVGHGEFGIARFDCIGKDWTCKKKTEGKMESRLLEDFQSPVGRLNCKSKIQK
jgi:hypothetical protein